MRRDQVRRVSSEAGMARSFFRSVGGGGTGTGCKDRARAEVDDPALGRSSRASLGRRDGCSEPLEPGPMAIRERTSSQTGGHLADTCS
jgi:hypothetical protein